MLLLLLRFLTLLAFGDGGLRAPADIGGERTLLVLFCCESLYFFPVFRVAAELTAQTFLFDGGLPILYAPFGFFSEGFLSAFCALLFLLSAGFSDPPFLRFR